MRKTLVCPACGADAQFPTVHVHGEAKGFERYHCDACGADMLTEDLVKKSHMGVYSPRGQAHGAGGGSLLTDTTGFPHMWRYSYCSGSGSPIVITPNVLLDTALLAKISRWHVTTLNISPFTDSDRPLYNTVFATLKANNPAIRTYLYNTCSVLTQNLGPDPTSFAREAWLLEIGPPDQRLYNSVDGTAYPSEVATLGVMHNLPNIGASYANLWKKYGAFGEGYWLDFFWDRPSTVQFFEPNNYPVNFALAGYGSPAALDAAYTTALQTFSTALQSDPSKTTIVNSGFFSTDATVFLNDGELIENWPPISFSLPTFDACMNRLLLWQGTNPTGDGSSFITMPIGNGPTQGDAAFRQPARFALGSACVAGGMSYTGNSVNQNLLNTVSNDMLTWADEYTVDANGVSDGTGTVAANRGWLGRPTAFGFKHSSGCWVREFQRGIVIVNGSGSTINHPLTGTWRRIRGVFDTTVNNGATVSGTVNVPTSDARFLLRT